MFFDNFESKTQQQSSYWIKYKNFEICVQYLLKVYKNYHKNIIDEWKTLTLNPLKFICFAVEGKLWCFLSMSFSPNSLQP